MSEFKKEKIGFEELGGVAGGKEVSLDHKCGNFKNSGLKESCPAKCKHCWHLMYEVGKGYFCKA